MRIFSGSQGVLCILRDQTAERGRESAGAGCRKADLNDGVRGAKYDSALKTFARGRNSRRQREEDPGIRQE